MASLILAELAGLIRRKVKDPRLNGISLTGVDVSPDLRQAKVFFSLMDESRAADAQKGFEAAGGFLRRELAQALHMKIIPRLVPVYDGSIKRGADMDQVIKRVMAEDLAKTED